MPDPTTAANAINSTAHQGLSRRRPWSILGILLAVLVNLAAAGCVAALALFTLSEARDERLAAQFEHNALAATSACLATMSLLGTVAGLLVTAWSCGQRGCRSLLVATGLACVSGITLGLLIRSAPLTGSADFRAMEGLGRFFLSLVAFASTGIVSLVNGLFLVLTQRRAAATS